MTRPFRCDVAKQMRNYALRKVIGLYPVLDSETLQFWHQAPMPADHPPHQPFMSEVIEAALFPIALARCVNKREVTRLIDCGDILRQKLRFERGGNFLRKTDADKTSCCDRIAVANEAYRLFRGDTLSGVRCSDLRKFRLDGGNG